MRKIFLLTAALCIFTGCELLSPDEVKNPNVEADDFASSPHAMQVWVNGTEANFGTAVATFAELTGLLSDDLLNTSSRSSKVYDQLDIHYTDVEVYKLSTHVGKLLEMTHYGLTTLAERDPETTSEHLFTLHFIRAYAYLLAGENFVALPREARGEVLEGEGLIRESLDVCSSIEPLAQTPRQQSMVALLKARAERNLGRWEQAGQAALRSLELLSDLLVTAQFDAINGFSNSLHEYVAGGLFAVAPQLQFEQDKFPMADYWNQPLPVVKSEEAWLIAAEAALHSGHSAEARERLVGLLQLVETRPMDVSAVSFTEADIETCPESDLMVMLYDLRQQVFFGEGRRASDMGIRLPISEVEYNEQGQLPERYTQAVIPAYLQSIRKEVDQHSDISRLLVSGLDL